MNHILRYTCIIATLLLLSGCAHNRVGLHNITPELPTLSQTYTDVDVDLAMVDNQNKRMFEEDLGRVWYTNRPSRLSPLPVVNTTGNSP
jgi:PBP1b-binding outer membrane lipoprotein LpoB